MKTEFVTCQIIGPFTVFSRLSDIVRSLLTSVYFCYSGAECKTSRTPREDWICRKGETTATPTNEWGDQSLWLFYYVFLNFINHNVLFPFFLLKGPWLRLFWSLMFRSLHFHDREKLLARQVSPCSQNHLLLIKGTCRKIWIYSLSHLFYRDGRLIFFILEFFKEFNKTTGDCLWGENGLGRKT